MMTDRYITQLSKQYFAFNIWSMETAKAVMDAASIMRCDIILQTSMKPFQLLDKAELRTFVDSYMKKKNIHVYLHLDHCRKMDLIEEAVRYGWDSVMFDASDKPLKENIRLVNEVCSMVRKKGLSVEAKIGQIGGTEEELSSTGAGMAGMDEIEAFLHETEIDMLAAAIGTSHGVYHSVPELHYNLIEQIAKVSDIPLVVHGGTGLSDEVLLTLLSYSNIKKINISTEVKLAYREGIRNSMQKGYLAESGFDPLRISEDIHSAIETMTMGKLRLLKKGETCEDGFGSEYGDEKHPEYYIR